MPIKYDYAWEKLFVAVLILSQGERSLRERLADAHTSSLIRLKMSAGAGSDFPTELRGEWEAIDAAFERAGRHDGEGLALASVRGMTDDEVRALAEKIVALFGEVAAHRGVVA